MAETKPRDGQRQRLYDAQRISGLMDDNANNPWTIKESQQFVNKVIKQEFTKKIFTKHKFWASQYPSLIVVEAFSRNHSKVITRNWETVRVIRLNNWGRNKFVLLHEIAHHITWGHEAHGAEFAEILLKLVKKHLGANAEVILQNSFHDCKVKVTNKSGKARVPRRRKIQCAKLAA